MSNKLKGFFILLFALSFVSFSSAQARTKYTCRPTMDKCETQYNKLPNHCKAISECKKEGGETFEGRGGALYSKPVKYCFTYQCEEK